MEPLMLSKRVALDKVDIRQPSQLSVSDHDLSSLINPANSIKDLNGDRQVISLKGTDIRTNDI